MQRYNLKPGTQVSLGDYDPEDISAFPNEKSEGREHLESLRIELRRLQTVLHAEKKHKVLIILQAMDAGGKDGAVRDVFRGVNAAGVRVVPFEKPTPRELSHDYLWRVHRCTPHNGQIAVFNRSHYEDVLAVRVRNLQPKSVWRKRFDHINDFERMLVDEGTTILKFFLHISHDEQKRRLSRRLENPDKHWKFDPSDLDDRKLWHDYVPAYEDVLTKTTTKHAPWCIVPANKKWFRSLVIADNLVDRLKELKMEFPKPKFDPKEYSVD